MELLVVSILCSVSVGVLFKFAKLNFSQLLWVLFFGYIVCFLAGYFLLVDTSVIEFLNSFSNLKWQEYSFIFILSLILPYVFISLQKSIVTQGVAKTDLVQRMSLLIPILASFRIFKEQFSWNKLVAILFGFVSIFLILNKQGSDVKNNDFKPLIIVFLGYGIVDVLFKFLTTLPFKTLLTFIFLGCLISTLFYIILKKLTFSWKSLPIGFALGILNFTNIFTYLSAHKAMKDAPTIVFTSMNLGVICLGALVGVLIFKEKLSKLNFIGIISAIFAIIILNFKLLFS
ncbi:EamA/RhaT family transporter [Capnocytophaga sp. ARDL2]|uniref:EamA/RhaT family transporter n=1 Tax=Capnocytophaga sp. ARDL2 TaxID=3238809 RepID=UPI0035589DF6